MSVMEAQLHLIYGHVDVLDKYLIDLMLLWLKLLRYVVAT